jgi:DNA polymerase III alpha subunit
MPTLPIFSSDHSINGSILTLDEPSEIKDNSPTSIFSIAKNHGLKEIFLVDRYFSGFIQAHKQVKSIGASLRFGIEFIICNDSHQKDEDSLLTECKVIVMMKNSNGYKDLIKLYTAIFTDKEAFYYRERGDWRVLKEHLTPNLQLIIPFYDSFIHRNLFEFGAHCLPDWANFTPIFLIEEHGIPYDEQLKGAVLDFCKNKYKYIDSHRCFYYNDVDFKAYLTLKCILGRKKFSKPNVEYLCSDKFSFEEFLKKNK